MFCKIFEIDSLSYGVCDLAHVHFESDLVLLRSVNETSELNVV